MAAYNPWYTLTYEKILEAVKWHDLLVDLDLKIALVFSWMPMVIMHHRENRTHAEIEAVLDGANSRFVGLPMADLWEIQHLSPHRDAIVSAFDGLRECLGGVAASKFLHFSRPRFFPMYDRRIAGIKSGDDYFRFIVHVRDKLRVRKNQEIAKTKYPANLLRGWDIHLMQTRGNPNKRLKRRPHKRRAARARR